MKYYHFYKSKIFKVYDFIKIVSKKFIFNQDLKFRNYKIVSKKFIF